MPPSINENSSKVVRKNFLLYSIEDNINISVLINFVIYILYFIFLLKAFIFLLYKWTIQ